jgi:hypothetical protein
MNKRIKKQKETVHYVVMTEIDTDVGIYGVFTDILNAVKHAEKYMKSGAGPLCIEAWEGDNLLQYATHCKREWFWQAVES